MFESLLLAVGGRSRKADYPAFLVLVVVVDSRADEEQVRCMYKYCAAEMRATMDSAEGKR